MALSKAARTFNSSRSRSSPEHLSDDAAIHFTNPGLCRGIRITNVLKCFGQVLRSGPQGNPQDYALSSRVDVIDAFLSHAWKDSWFAKVQAIVLYYNDGNAAIASNVVVLVAGFGQLMGWLPVYCYEHETERISGNPFRECPDTEFKRVQGLWCVVCGWTTYFFVLFLGHRLLSLFFKTPFVFLDKVCIQQCVDHGEIDMGCPRCSVKHDGIRNLGAFLRKSKKLVILYTDSYFSRAWCCYEYACFIAVNSLESIELLPLARPAILWVLAILSMLLQAGNWFEKVSNDVGMISFTLLTAMCVLPLVWTCRRWGLERDQILNRIQNFDVHEAECKVQSDKNIVLSRIANWSRKRRSSNGGPEPEGRRSSKRRPSRSITTSMILGRSQALPDLEEAALGLAEPQATRDEAIEAFNDYIRTEGAAAMERCLGSSATPYSSILPIALSFAWRSLDHITANLSIKRYDTSDALVKTIEAFSASVIFIPLAISLVSRTATWCPGLSHSLPRDLCFCMVLSVVFTAVFSLGTILMNLLAEFLRGKGSREAARLDYLWIYFVLDLAGLMLLIHAQAHPYARSASVETRRDSRVPDACEGAASRQSGSSKEGPKGPEDSINMPVKSERSTVAAEDVSVYEIDPANSWARVSL